MLMMKWKNPGITYFGGGNGGGGTGGTQTFTSDLEGLAGQTFNSQEELTAAEQGLNQTNAEAAGTAAQTQVETVAADPATSMSTAQTNMTNLQAQIDALSPQLADNPEIQTQIDALSEQMMQEQQTLNQSSQLVNQQLGAAQQQMMNAATTDPSSLIQQAGVATTQESPDQIIAEGTGQVATTPDAQVSTVEETATAVTPARQEAGEYDATKVGNAADVITEDLQAAVAEPSEKATVRGQLAMLMQDFEGGETPPWASGPMRQAMSVMQSRGMGASSIAGAAVVQAAMESAISIAGQDASTNAQFEMQNLNNQQQTSIFKTQQRLSALFSDQASENASKQFNATSQNQTNQFFSNLEATASQFNSAQINAIRQFNSGQENAMTEFNTTVRNQRDQFNAQNSLIISQANAQWRQNIATTATAAQNVSNLEYTKNTNAITGAMLDQLWQRERDLMDYAFTASESGADRANAIFLQRLAADANIEAARLQGQMEADAGFGNFLGEVATGLLGF